MDPFNNFNPNDGNRDDKPNRRIGKRLDDNSDDQSSDDSNEIKHKPLTSDENEANAKNEETFGPSAEMWINGHNSELPSALDQTSVLINGSAGSAESFLKWQPNNDYMSEIRSPLRPILKKQEKWELVYSTAPGGPNAFRFTDPDPGPSRNSASTSSQWYNKYVEDTQRSVNGFSPRRNERHVRFVDNEDQRSNNANDNSYGLGNLAQMTNSLPSFNESPFGLQPLLTNRFESDNSENEPPITPMGSGSNLIANWTELFERSRQVFRQEDQYLRERWNRNAEAFSTNSNNNQSISNPFRNPLPTESIWKPATGKFMSFLGSDDGPNKVFRLLNDFRKTAIKIPPNYTWSGQLPRKARNKTPIYSCKVFLGGIPYDLTDSDLHCTFAQFGHIQIQWPGKDIRSAIDGAAANKAGYVYIIFENYDNVAALLNACTVSYRDTDTGPKWYYSISSRRQRGKEVQVIPFDIGDRFYMKSSFSGQMEHSRTVFVGACHGMLSAEGLAKVMDDLFGGVVFAGLDTDKYKYPLGSARVSFDNHESYMKAISAAFVEIKSARFKKKIQIDPYIENEMSCAYCGIQQSSPIFCRDHFQYFCPMCWSENHSDPESSKHRPIIKNKPSNT